MSKTKPVRHDDAAMIKDPDRWPCWPYLPVKRKNNSLEDQNLGLVLATEQLVHSGKPTVYYCYLFDLPKSFTDVPKTEYESVETMLADGWIVD